MMMRGLGRIFLTTIGGFVILQCFPSGLRKVTSSMLRVRMKSRSKLVIVEKTQPMMFAAAISVPPKNAPVKSLYCKLLSAKHVL